MRQLRRMRPRPRRFRVCVCPGLRRRCRVRRMRAQLLQRERRVLAGDPELPRRLLHAGGRPSLPRVPRRLLLGAGRLVHDAAGWRAGCCLRRFCAGGGRGADHRGIHDTLPGEAQACATHRL